MTWVKLCGMRTDEDVAIAAEVGADAIGFVLDPASPRFVDAADVTRLASRTEMATFLVVVDADPVTIVALADKTAVRGVQPHGHHNRAVAEAALRAGLDVLFPVAVGRSAPTVDVPEGAVPLFDTEDPDRHGGTGEQFDWDLLSDQVGRFVVAGGLTPDNVAAAVERTGAWGVDVSSGIESSPGHKDSRRMKRFVEAVR